MERCAVYLRCVMMACENGQFVEGTLHEMGIGKGTNRIQALGDMVRIVTNDLLRWICVEDDDQQAAVFAFVLIVIGCFVHDGQLISSMSF